MTNPYLQDAGLTADGIFLKLATAAASKAVFQSRPFQRGILDDLMAAFKKTKKKPTDENIADAYRKAHKAAPEDLRDQLAPQYYRSGFDTPGQYTTEGNQLIKDLREAMDQRISRSNLIRNAGLVGAGGIGAGAIYGYNAHKNQAKPGLMYY